MTQEQKLIELLRDATYKRKGGEPYCRGSFQLGSGCMKCPSCLWEIKRQQVLSQFDETREVTK